MKSTPQRMQRLVWLNTLAAATALTLGGFAFAADPNAPMSGADPATSAATPGKTGKAEVPSPTESADAAFGKLAAGKQFIMPEDAKALPGFDKVFDASDANHDGRLSAAEFKSAWKAYTAADKGTRG